MPIQLSVSLQDLYACFAADAIASPRESGCGEQVPEAVHRRGAWRIAHLTPPLCRLCFLSLLYEFVRLSARLCVPHSRAIPRVTAQFRF